LAHSEISFIGSAAWENANAVPHTNKKIRFIVPGIIQAGHDENEA
jgi:hypothetical protein